MPPVLSQRARNRALLARQLLLERADLPIPRALDRMAGLQAQYAPAMYIGLWSRLTGLTRDDLTRALERRTVVQGTLLRSTIHLVSAADYWSYAVGIRDARRSWYQRVAKVDPTDVERAVRAVRTALADGPLHRAELDRLAGPSVRTAVGLWLDLVRVPPSGTWDRRRADLYALAEDWLGGPDVTPETALETLVRRYLAGFGPATRADIARWAGVPVATIAPALAKLPLVELRGADGAKLLDLPDAPRPDPDTPAPVRFLPVWDATLLVHARATGILPEEYRPRIFHVRAPHSFNTFLVDGAVAGTWRYGDGRIDTDEFAPLDRAARRAVAEEGERLVGLYQ